MGTGSHTPGPAPHRVNTHLVFVRDDVNHVSCVAPENGTPSPGLTEGEGELGELGTDHCSSCGVYLETLKINVKSNVAMELRTLWTNSLSSFLCAFPPLLI